MKYNVGDRVRIKSLDWYNENKDEFGEVRYEEYIFVKSMVSYCGSILTIEDKTEDYYQVKENTFWWTDEMIEGLVAHSDCKKCGLTFMSTRCLFMDNCPHNQPKNTIEIPKGWVLKDENGNVINTTKIVLEKKKKEYPKTLGECRAILGIMSEYGAFNYKANLITTFMSLLICRDAYWKIAGEEMGLGKPWEPEDSDYITERYCIFVHRNNVLCATPAEDCVLTFPTEEMRDAFYENFKSEIESCKELL